MERDNVVDSLSAPSGRTHQGPRDERHQFRSRVRAFWHRVSGLPQEVALEVKGLSLVEASAGQRVKVLHVQGGCQRMRRLLEIGLYPDAEIEVASAGDRGPVIVRIGESRLAIGRNVARSVMVEPIAPA